MSTNNNTLQDKIKEYATFISGTLQPQLQLAVEAKESTERDISDYKQLRNTLHHLKNSNTTINNNSSSDSNKNNNNNEQYKPIDALVDVAHDTIYCRTIIANPRTLYVDVGLGFMVELTVDEALSFIDKRVAHLETGVLKHQKSAAEGIAKDVEDALDLLEELGAELPER